MAKAQPNYGQVWSSVPALTSPSVYVSGNRAVAEAVAWRLQTPRGGLIDDPTYGFDLTAYLDDDVSPADIAAIQSGVQQECLKDERVADAVVTVTLNNGVLLVTAQLTLVTNQTFALVLSVSAVAANPVQILSVQP